MAMIKPTAETLLSLNLFRDLSAPERNALAAHCRAHRYSKGQQILAYEDQSRDVFFVVSGQVRATIYTASGREVTFRDLGAGEDFGGLSALDSQPRASSVIALSDTMALSMPPTAFREALRRHPSIALRMLQALSALVRLLSNRVVEFSTLGVRNRIHAELLRLAKNSLETGDTAIITPSPRHVDIASRISTHREAVTRELNQLISEGLLERRGRALIITSVGKLQRMVEEVRKGK